MIEILYDKAPCGYFAFKDDGTILMLNETLASTLKYSKDELTGRNVEVIFTIATRIFFQTHFFPLVRMHGKAEEIFLTLLSKDGEHLPILLNAKRMQWEEHVLTCCAFIIVPNRKKFEDDLVSARKAAENALLENTELMEAKADLQQQTEKLNEQIRLVRKQNHELQQFSHVVTHNLKEPLRKMLVYTGMLQTQVESAAMDKLLRSTDQMKAVVSGLQLYVWLNEKENTFSQVDLNLVVQKAAEQLSNELSAELYELHFDALPSLEGDAQQLQLLIYHLLSNAVKFRRTDKAVIRMNSTIIKQNTLRSVEDKYKYEDFVRLEVIDEGIGFDLTYREHIFELFRKLHFSDGLGLGLALCKKVADNHHGFIEAESEINLFTKITAWLPLEQQKGTQ